MLDPRLIREKKEDVKRALVNRGEKPDIIDKFIEVDEKWRKLTHEVDELKSQRNKSSDKVAALKKDKKDASDIVEKVKKIGSEIKDKEEVLRKLQLELDAVSLSIPNIPHVSVPVGRDQSGNKEIRKWGNARKTDFKPKAHFELGEELGILDFQAAAKISGSRFVVYRDKGALLERALINFMLDVHIKEHCYREVMPPFMTCRDAMVGTGQLPKFEEDLYKCSDDLYLAPTAEVPVTNIHRDEILSKEKLPIKYVSYTPCFRREAGSYGKDVRGLIRQHQFNKVELVKFTEPEASYSELESLTVDAEKILQKLDIPYRVVVLCTGDMGFAASKTYDIEVWFPSEDRYREISSCSNFEDFQARRANIKFRRSKDAKPEYVHTLNGSGLAVGRTFAALLENFQNADGSIDIPKVLQPYMEANKIARG